MLNLRYTKYYYETLRFLLKRGHRIHLGFFNPKEPAKETLHERLVSEFPNLLSCGIVSRKRADVWHDLSIAFSWGMDYLLYLSPLFKDANRLRERVEIRIHPGFVWLMNKCPIIKTSRGLAFMKRLLQVSYDSIPAARSIKKFIKEFKPDVVLITPLVVHGTLECEYLKASRDLGVVNAHCVASWDNLTTKGVIKGNPDRVIVWNETQKKEAVALHRISPEKIVVTGAQYFDEWFARGPSRNREEFCKAVGLQTDRPILLYICSSNFMAPNETKFVLRWIAAIRKCGIPELVDAGILIRPYPENVEHWKGVDFSDYGNVVVWPPGGEYPHTEVGKMNFYDSIYHAMAVIGINTTAMIESAVIGRCVLTVLAPELNESQTNTIHFNYLRQENGGFLYLAHDLEEHLAQLKEILDKGDGMEVQVAKFVRNFVRPHGIEKECVPILGQTIEELRLSTVDKVELTTGKILLRGVLYPIALLLKLFKLVSRIKTKGEKRELKKLLKEAHKRGHDPLEYVRPRRRDR